VDFTELQKLIDWVAQFGLWGSVACLLIGGGVLGLAHFSGSPFAGSSARGYMTAGAIGAALLGVSGFVVTFWSNAFPGVWK
jgi:hypothetical protein